MHRNAMTAWEAWRVWSRCIWWYFKVGRIASAMPVMALRHTILQILALLLGQHMAIYLIEIEKYSHGA